VEFGPASARDRVARNRLRADRDNSTVVRALRSAGDADPFSVERVTQRLASFEAHDHPLRHPPVRSLPLPDRERLGHPRQPGAPGGDALFSVNRSPCFRCQRRLHVFWSRRLRVAPGRRHRVSLPDSNNLARRSSRIPSPNTGIFTRSRRKPEGRPANSKARRCATLRSTAPYNARRQRRDARGGDRTLTPPADGRLPGAPNRGIGHDNRARARQSAVLC